MEATEFEIGFVLFFFFFFVLSGLGLRFLSL